MGYLLVYQCIHNEKARRNGSKMDKKMFEEIMVKNFSNLMRNFDLLVQFKITS